MGSKKRQLWKSALFFVTVVIPTALAVAYFGFFSSNIYISESKFVVRSPQKFGMPSVSDIFSKMGMAKSDEDSFAVREFILSRDALKVLNADLNIKASYSRPEIDVLERFPGWRYWDTSLEAFYRYYLKQVGVVVDSGSSVAVLTVKAFDPEDALKINQKLIEMSEAFVNKLNERARLDLLKSANDEVTLAKAKVEATTLALMAIRTQRPDANPEKQVIAQQRLTLEQGFAQQQLATAMTSLEQSRIEALRKQVYIERLTQPVKPDYHVLPDRLKGIAATAVLSLMLWGILLLLIAGVKEHHV